MKFVIPARKGSKGLPGKNRILLEHTIEQIPQESQSDVIVTTDDEHIIDALKATKVNILHRSDELGGDTVSTKDVMADVIKRFKIPNDEVVVMLYLTYPERNWKEVSAAIKFFEDKGAKSLLCKKEIKAHPYLCMYEQDNYKGKQIVKHNLYRRQDYPKCFEISHYVCIFTPSEIKFLNKNLYNSNTLFFPIEDRIDVDAKRDLDMFYGKSNC